MTYQFSYSYGSDAWKLAYEPQGLDGYPEPQYELPGDLPEGDWSLYGEVFGVSDNACIGLLVMMDDDTTVQWLGTWHWNVPPSNEPNVWVRQGTANIPLRILYDSEAGELRLQYLDGGVWQTAQSVPVTTPVDTGLILRYGYEDQRVEGFIGGVRLLEGIEEPDGFAETQLGPTTMAAPSGVQPSLLVSTEPTVYALMGAPFGDLEFDVGKSARWLEYFCDKLFILDVNLGDPRYWIVNWTITFPDAEHAVTSINFFERPIEFRKEQFRLADKAYHMEDDAWVLWVDASEGLSFDNRSLPDDYASNPFMSFVYREIARAEAASRDFASIPFFVFLRSDEVQNVTYAHRSNTDDGPSVLQPVSVPYYTFVDPAFSCMIRLMKVSRLRDAEDYIWEEIDTPFGPLEDVKAQIVSYAYAHWNLQDVPPGATEPAPLSEDNDDGWRMRKRISKVRPIPELPIDVWDPDSEPVGMPGPWAAYVTTNTIPDFEPITDTPVTEPDAVTAGICTPLYDCVIRLNMRDGVWYEGDVSGNTPMMWDAVNGKWQTAYDPELWPEVGVRAGDNPEYVDQPSPLPPAIPPDP